jgi:hypothetical protein
MSDDDEQHFRARLKDDIISGERFPSFWHVIGSRSNLPFSEILHEEDVRRLTTKHNVSNIIRW